MASNSSSVASCVTKALLSLARSRNREPPNCNTWQLRYLPAVHGLLASPGVAGSLPRMYQFLSRRRHSSSVRPSSPKVNAFLHSVLLLSSSSSWWRLQVMIYPVCRPACIIRESVAKPCLATIWFDRGAGAFARGRGASALAVAATAAVGLRVELQVLRVVMPMSSRVPASRRTPTRARSLKSARVSPSLPTKRTGTSSSSSSNRAPRRLSTSSRMFR